MDSINFKERYTSFSPPSATKMGEGIGSILKQTSTLKGLHRL